MGAALLKTTTELEVVLLGDGDREIDRCAGPLPVVLPDRHVRVVGGRDQTEVHVRLRAAGRGIGRKSETQDALPDVFAGRLPVVFGGTRGTELSVAWLTVPPPKPFDIDAVDEMWRAACELPEAVPASIRHQGSWSAAAKREVGIDALDLPSLPRLIDCSRALLARWPQRESSEEFWRPVELAGGRERPAQTLRSPRSRIANVDGALAPERTLRVRSTAAPWKLHAASTLAVALLKELKKLDERQSGTALASTIETIADKARPSGGHIDPPPSGWPSELRAFVDAALDALGEAAARSSGEGHAPLCDLWRLYEAWVGQQVLKDLERELGTPDIGPVVCERPNSRGEPVVYAGWEERETLATELWLQRGIRSTPVRLGGRHVGRSIRSITAELIPDVLVCHASPHDHRVVLLDAKHRGAKRLTGGNAGEAASKYLWGLRYADDVDAPAVERVILVASGGTSAMYEPARSRISGMEAYPGEETVWPAELSGDWSRGDALRSRVAGRKASDPGSV